MITYLQNSNGKLNDKNILDTPKILNNSIAEKNSTTTS